MAQSDLFYSEAIQSYQIQVSEKQIEINRLKKDLQDLKESTKREEELMSSAWYNLCSTFHAKDYEKLAAGSNWLSLKNSDKL